MEEIDQYIENCHPYQFHHSTDLTALHLPWNISVINSPQFIIGITFQWLFSETPQLQRFSQRYSSCECYLHYLGALSTVLIGHALSTTIYLESKSGGKQYNSHHICQLHSQT